MSYFRSLTINHALVPGTQSDFPVVVSVTDATLKTVANGGHVDNGFDIGFYADVAGTTKLKWEVESYDATTGVLVAHVKVPSISSSADTVFYMLYGDSAVTTDQSDAAGVWSNGYVGVWHFGDGATLNTNDSLGAHNGTPGGPVAAITGQIRGGSFYQVPSYMAFGDIGIHTLPFSFEAWVAPYNNVYASLLNTGSWNGHYLSHDPSGLTHAAVTVTNGFASYSVASQTSAGAMVWQHVAAVWTNDSSRQVFVNGIGGTLDTTTIVPIAVTDGFVLGADFAHSNGFYGYLDEVRVSNVARSADWIATCYNAQSNPSAFVAFGAEQVPTLPSVDVYLVGVGANPQVGAVTFEIDVFVSLVGVAANPQIGVGTVQTGGVVVTPPEEELVPGPWFWPQEVTVYLTGVAASPEVGRITLIAKGTLDDLARRYPFPRQPLTPKAIPRLVEWRSVVEEPVPASVVVHLSGVKMVPIVGTGTVKRVFELLDDEILALLEAA